MKRGFTILKRTVFFVFLLFLLIGPGLFYNLTLAEANQTPETDGSSSDPHSRTYTSEGKQITITRISSTSSKTGETTSITPEDETEITQNIHTFGQILTSSCTTPVKDALVIDQGYNKNYLTNNGFTYDTLPYNQFGLLTAATLTQYRFLIMEPGWVNVNQITAGLSVVQTVLQTTDCLTVALRIAGKAGSNLDFVGTDITATASDTVTFYNPTHPLITGSGYGGTQLYASDLTGWGSTSVGNFIQASLPIGQIGYQPILNNSNGIVLMEYHYGRGHVIVDTLSSLSGGWGTGNAYFASNYMKYLNYSSYQVQSPVLAEYTPDPTIKEFTTGNALEWRFRDTDPTSYVIEKDGSPVQTSNWIDNETISISIDGLSRGSYNYTIIITDLLGHMTIDTVLVSIQDGINPIFTSIPNDMNYDYGDTGNTLTWIATDELQSGTYNVWIEGIVASSGSWTNNTEIIINIDGFTEGIYNVTLEIFDAANNSAFDSTEVTVNPDNTAPSFVNPPQNTSIPLVSTGNILSWNVSEKLPNTYTIYKDSIQVDIGVYTSGVLISWNIDGDPLGVYNYTIVVTDTSGGLAEHTLFVTVYDGVFPIFTVTPDPLIAYEYGSTGNVLKWAAYDVYNTEFEIYRNNSMLFSTSWLNNVNVSINIDGLALGYYNYTAVFYDITSNGATYTTIVHVVDTTSPTLTNSSGDSIKEQRSTGAKISWKAFDLNPNSYSVFLNNSEYQDGNWVSSTAVQVTVDTTQLGFFNYTILFNDTSGNNLVETIIVHIMDTIDPVVSGPSSYPTYVEDSSSNFIDWSVVDLNPDYYEIYRQNSLIATGGWLSGSTIHFNIDGLTTGIYNFTLTAYDESGRFDTYQVDVTVVDQANPSFTNSPGDFIYSFGTSGNTITWVATDNHPASYIVYRNSTIVKTGSWISAGSIIINIDGLAEDLYNFTIIVLDQSGLTQTDTVFVTVSGAPVIDSGITEYHYTNDTSGHVLSWIIEDANPDYYIITNNTIEVKSGSWSNGIPVTVNIDNLPIGEYNFTIWANDTEGLAVNNKITVYVTDIPILGISPSLLTYDEGDPTTYSLEWSATDSEPGIFEIYKNDIMVLTDDWNNTGTVKIYVNGLLKGNYNYTIVFYDLSDNSIDHTQYVYVEDNTSPSFDGTPNYTSYNESSSGNSIIWSVTDAYPDYYYIERNGTDITGSLPWNSITDITYLIDSSIYKGVYNFTIIVYDKSGNWDFSTVYITINDVTKPSSTQPSSVTYSEGTTSSVMWNATDLHPWNYTITYNGGNEQTGYWDNATYITFNLNNTLAAGSYEFILTVFDTSNNNFTSSVTVTVTDNTDPTIDEPSDNLLYVQDSSGNTIVWTGMDIHAGTYTIKRNDTDWGTYVGLSWTDGVGISVDMDGLELGTHNFTIYLYDASGNFVTDSVIVLVTDQTNPGISNPSGFSYEYGDLTQSITWNPSDTNPTTYSIRKNGTLIEGPQLWNDGIDITIDVDGLPLGYHNYTITIEDIAGFQTSHTVIIHVVDTTIPIISTPSPVTYEQGTTSNTISWTVTDLLPGVYNVTVDGEFYSSVWVSGVAIVVDIDDLSYGSYDITLYVNDTSGNEVSNTVNVLVTDTTQPQVNSPVDFSFTEGTPNQWINWTLTDLNPKNYTIFENDLEIDNQAWINNQKISLNISDNSFGLYNYTILIYDSNDNFRIDTVLVTVKDTQPPTFTLNPSSYSFVQGSSNNFLNWTATDNNFATYNVTIDSVFNTTGSWNDLELISISVDNLSYGIHELLVEVFDASGNILSSTVYITVLDDTAPLVNTFNDLSVELGVSGLIQWNASDVNPNNYNITINGSLVQFGAWTTGTNTTFDYGTLDIGINLLNITFYDIAGNYVSNTLTITVTDTVFNSLLGLGDMEYEDGVGDVIPWIASDYDPATYTVLINGSIYYNLINYENLPWFDGVSVDVPLSNLDIGFYNFTVIFTDGSGHIAVDTVIVHVKDTLAPSVASPDDFSHEQGSGIEYLTWTPEDANPDTYTIYVDAVVNRSGTWISGVPIQFDVNLLGYGSHTLNITLHDSNGLTISNEVIITITDITAPIIAAENDFNYEENTSRLVTWSITEYNPQNYTLYLNSSVIVSTIWGGSDIQYDITGLNKGVYEYTLLVEDVFGHQSSGTVIVTVIELNSPVIISSPNVLTYGELQGPYTLHWNVTDKYPGTYFAYLDNVLISDYLNQPWSNNFLVTVNVPSQLIGTYTLKILIYDVFGNIVQDEFDITITDLSSPKFDRAPFGDNQTFVSGETKSMYWVIIDTHPNTYSVYIDDSVLLNNEPWASPQPIYLFSNQFTVGTHNLTIVAFDTFGNFNTYFTYVIITDEVSPTLITQPTDLSYNENTTANVLVWEFDDASLHGTYDFYRNGSLLLTGDWDKNVEVILNIDGLTMGWYNFSVIAFDDYENSIEDWVGVTVYDANIPVFISEPSTFSYFEGELILLTWELSESHPESYEIWINDDLYTLATWSDTIKLNATLFDPDVYNITLIVWDTSSNTNSAEITVEIIDNINPEFISPYPEDLEFTRENGNDRIIEWYAYDRHPSTYTILKDGALLSTDVWDNVSPISYDTSLLSFGEYTLTVIIEDTSDNSASFTIKVKVKDPAITETLKPDISEEDLIVHEGDYQIINGTWLTRFTEEPVSQGKIQVQLIGGQTNSQNFFVNTNDEGYYEIPLDYSRIPVGKYSWQIHFSKQDYEEWDVEIQFTVTPHNYRIEISVDPQLRKGEKYYISATVFYNNDAPSSLGLNEFVQRGGIVVGISVTFKITYVSDDGSTVNTDQPFDTSSLGTATWSVLASTTSNIKKVVGISATIEENEFGSGITQELQASELPEVVSPEIDISGAIGQFIADNFALLILLILFILSMFVLIFVVRKRFTSRLKTTLKEMGDAKSELLDLESIRAIIIQSDSGVPLYERRIHQFGVDTTLVSGLLSAVSAFLSEVGDSDQEGFETLERESLSIITHKANYSNVIFISTKKLTLGTLDKIRLIHWDMEKKFSNHLQNFVAGEFLDEDVTDDMFEKYGLNLNLFNTLKLNKRNLRRISKMRSINRAVRDNIKLMEKPFYGKPGASLDLNDIREELETVSHLTDEMIARVILLTYRNGALEPDEAD